MIFYIPLFIIIGSLVAISYIIGRKMPYLKKVSLEVGGERVSFWADLFPGPAVLVRKIDFSAYEEKWFNEFEKFLRRVRVVSLKIDSFADRLLEKLRERNGKNGAAVEVPTEALKPEDSFDFKKEEQRLIIEVAKNPKDPGLYKVLGDLYIKAGNLSDAKESFEAAIELNSNNEEIKKKTITSTRKTKQT